MLIMDEWAKLIVRFLQLKTIVLGGQHEKISSFCGFINLTDTH